MNQYRQDINSYSDKNSNGLVRDTAHFNGETDHEAYDQNMYSSKPSTDKIIIKNRGHSKSNQQEGTFLEMYGKNHIKSEQILLENSGRSIGNLRRQTSPKSSG